MIGLQDSKELIIRIFISAGFKYVLLTTRTTNGTQPIWRLQGQYSKEHRTKLGKCGLHMRPMRFHMKLRLVKPTFEIVSGKLETDQVACISLLVRCT
jgi:hypothetical protein